MQPRVPSVELDAEFHVLRAPRAGRSDRRPLRGVAPAFILHLRGPQEPAERAATELWCAAAGSGAPQVWADEWAAAHGLQMRVWEDAVCRVRPSRRPGLWDFTFVVPPGGAVPGPLLSRPTRERGLADLRAGPQERLRFRAGDTALTAVRNLHARAGWLFLVVRANGRDLGALAVRRLQIAAWSAAWAAIRCRLRPESAARPASTRVRVSLDSLSGPLRDARAVAAALGDPAVVDIAAVMEVTFRGDGQEARAAALWARYAGSGPARPAPEPWILHFARRRGLGVHVADGVVLCMRRQGPSGPAETWLAGSDGGEPGLRLQLDAVTAAGLETAMTRSGWLFVVPGTPGGALGVLAVCQARVLRGPAASA